MVERDESSKFKLPKSNHMRKSIVGLIIFYFSFPAISQNSQDSSWMRDNYFKIERTIPMRDGVKLFTAILSPVDAKKPAPILIVRTPYGADLPVKDNAVVPVTNNFPNCNCVLIPNNDWAPGIREPFEENETLPASIRLIISSSVPE